MKRIRIGNDIKVVVTVRHNGEDVSMEGRALKVVLQSRLRMVTFHDYTVSGNVVSFTWWGKDQRKEGTYYVTIYELFDDGGQSVVDTIDAFTLIPRTELTSTEGILDPNITTEVVDLSVDFNLRGADGLSAYQIAIIHGFIGTEEEWLASLKGETGNLIYPTFDVNDNMELEMSGPADEGQFEINGNGELILNIS